MTASWEGKLPLNQGIRKEVKYLVAVFLLLCVVSAYWQIGKKLFPSDAFRPVIIFFIYVLLLATWWGSVRNRVTQRNMRIFLSAENLSMVFGMTVRFLQEAYRHRLLYGTLTNNDVFLFRFSGYCTNIAFILIPLFGLYASFGLGKTEEYRFSRYWYTLLAPAVVLTSLVLTNDLHYFIYRPLQDEANSFRVFRPNIGFYMLILWAFLLLFIRIFVLYRKSRESFDKTDAFSFIRLMPLLFTVLIILSNIPYIATNFLWGFELFEQEVTLFFLEILVWESSIYIGMIPVNTHYDEVFNRSAVAMQILAGDGEPYLQSLGAYQISPELFIMLKEELTVRTQEGKDLHLRAIRGGYAIWSTDVSQTLAVINELRQSAEMLEQDVVLLRNELAIRSDEQTVKEKNLIYNRLIDETSKQRMLLRCLLEGHEQIADKVVLFKQICLIGAYIKRRCHLRLVEQSDGIISNAELEFCFIELNSCLRDMGITSEVIWHTSQMLEPEFAIFALDVFEALLEYENFEINSIRMDLETNRAFSMQLQLCRCSPKQFPADELRRINKDNNSIKFQPLDTGYKVTVSRCESLCPPALDTEI